MGRKRFLDLGTGWTVVFALELSPRRRGATGTTDSMLPGCAKRRNIVSGLYGLGSYRFLFLFPFLWLSPVCFHLSLVDLAACVFFSFGREI